MVCVVLVVSQSTVSICRSHKEPRGTAIHQRPAGNDASSLQAPNTVRQFKEHLPSSFAGKPSQNTRKIAECDRGAAKLQALTETNSHHLKTRQSTNIPSMDTAVEDKKGRRNQTRSIRIGFELDDSDDLCPVCVDICTCQPSSHFMNEAIDILAPEDSLISPKKLVQKRANLIVNADANKRNRFSSQNTTDNISCLDHMSVVMEVDLPVSIYADGNGNFIQKAHLNQTASPHTGKNENKFAIDLNSGMIVNRDGSHSFSFSDGDDLLLEEYEEEEWDSDDDVCLKYDSVEYEYLVNDLLENEMISELASMEDPIESLDILLFGSSEDDEEENIGMQGISFELDLIPSQRQILSDIRSSSQPIPIPTAMKPKSYSQENFGSLEKKSSFSNYILNLETGTLSSQPFFPHAGSRNIDESSSTCGISQEQKSESQLHSCQYKSEIAPSFAVYTSGSLSGSSLSSVALDDAYDSYCDEDSCWPYSTSPHDGGGNSDTGMLSIEDILDSTLYTNSRQVSYKNEFLDRYKHIPITTFRRTRRKSLSHFKQSRVNYKRLIKHGDFMLCDATVGKERTEGELFLISSPTILPSNHRQESIIS